MQNIKLIIGANYGDEGKGLATDFFGAKAEGRFNVINVLTNGGPQRGHTVELSDGRRHVFKHFGAASFRGAASYFAEQFIVNPMEFMREYDDLRAVHETPEAFVNPRCRFSTPWDILTNQMFSEKNGLHNSCGFGIWETVLRYRKGFGISFGTFAAMNTEDRIAYLRGLRDSYFAILLAKAGHRVTGVDLTAAMQTAGVHLEITNLLVTGLNDSEEQVRKLCQWMVDNGLQDVPLHFSRYFPRYRYKESPTPASTLKNAREVAHSAGIQTVFLGNI